MTANAERQPTAEIEDVEEFDECEDALEPERPDVEQWDAYVARVQKRFDDELLHGLQHGGDGLRAAFKNPRLCDASFDELERACGLRLDEEARSAIHASIALYGFAGHDRHREKAIYEEDTLLASEVETLASKIEARLNFGARDPAIEIPFILREYRRTILTFRMHSPRGRPRRRHDDNLIDSMAWVFRRAGGWIAISETGPFTRFLKATWELLPADTRPLSADALVAHAKASLPKLRRERPEMFDKGKKWPPPELI